MCERDAIPHHPVPTLYDQIRALWGVRDCLLALAEREANLAVPNHEYVLDYLARSVDIATDALYSSLEKHPADDATLLQPTKECKGFGEPYGVGITRERGVHEPLPTQEERRPPSSTTISN